MLSLALWYHHFDGRRRQTNFVVARLQTHTDFKRLRGWLVERRPNLDLVFVNLIFADDWVIDELAGRIRDLGGDVTELHNHLARLEVFVSHRVRIQMPALLDLKIDDDDVLSRCGLIELGLYFDNGIGFLCGAGGRQW